jgi:hypothetical protein
MTHRIIVTARNDRFPTFLPGREPQLGRGLNPSAPSFDLTAEQWIVPPSGKQPDAGASAEQGQTQAAQTRPAGPLAPLNRRAGRPHLKAAIAECCTTAFGLLVFGLIAWTFLVLA